MMHDDGGKAFSLIALTLLVNLIFSPEFFGAFAQQLRDADDKQLTHTFAVHLVSGVHADRVAAELGFLNLGPVGDLEGLYMFTPDNTTVKQVSRRSEEGHMDSLKSHRSIRWTEQQVTPSLKRESVTVTFMYGNLCLYPRLRRS